MFGTQINDSQPRTRASGNTRVATLAAELSVLIVLELRARCIRSSRNMKRTVVWLTDGQIKALAAMSKRSLAPMSALVRKAVNEFLLRSRKVQRSPWSKGER